jgi:hypothetical protein
MIIREACPECGSTRSKKNGHTRHGKQQHQCKACERQFSASAENLSISHERRTLLANLLRERLSLRGICRAVGVSLTWLLHFMVECFAACPDHLCVQLPEKPTDVVIYQREAEADEMWSVVQKKANKIKIDIIANKQIDQKGVELSASQHYSLVENSMSRAVFPSQEVSDGVFLPSSQRASEAFAGHDWSDSR